jgi:RNA polymerase subunit RPABC4/transcription elongation factor Spt4
MQFPTELLNQIAVALEVAVACLTALLVAFWIGLVIWTFRDIRAMLLRPRETLDQSYDRQLEEEALLRDITTRRACPSCQAVTEPDWLICPHCRTELRRTCEECGRPLELNWKVCPYCATPVVKTKGANTGQPTLPASPANDAYELDDQDTSLEPTTTIVSEPTTEFVPESATEQEYEDEQ